MPKMKNSIYYQIKPLIPRRLQIRLRRKLVLHKRKNSSNIWPILEAAAQPPKNWAGWPQQKQFALILTHDVDTEKGQNKCRQLMGLEEKLGFRSSYNFVPERYEVSAQLRNDLMLRGFEVGVHGLNHDGKLFQSKKIFNHRSKKINHYLKEWRASGFRAPAMHHNLEWIHDLTIEYDSSTFDTDPFEPQPEGVKTIFPFWVQSKSRQNRYLELPYTLPQDFTLFILMGETDIDVWKLKLDWIAKQGGMVLLNVHPDYICFNGGKPSIEEYPVAVYHQFLEYVQAEYKNQYWHVLPNELAALWNSLQFS